MSENIIRFDGSERLLDRVRDYLVCLDELISDGDQGADLLLKAFRIADEELKVKIVIMLGALARPRVAWTLLDIMRDVSQGENIRLSAAIQISVIGAALEENEELVEQLRKDLNAEAPFVRANAAFALGWEGNSKAIPDLIDSLSDKDIEVQQAAVNALANLRDDQVFSMLVQRLETGAKEQQRSILYNLSHFRSRHEEAAKICRAFVDHNDPDLRYDAMVVLHGLSDVSRELSVYEKGLEDPDARIRELALMRLRAVQRTALKDIAPKVRRLVKDPRIRVRQAATQLLHHIDSLSLAKED